MWWDSSRVPVGEGGNAHHKLLGDNRPDGQANAGGRQCTADEAEGRPLRAGQHRLAALRHLHVPVQQPFRT